MVKFLPLSTLAYNTFNSPNLGNYSPYDLVFSRKPKVLLDLETDPDIKVSRTFKDYYTPLNKRLKYLWDILQQFESKQLAMINKNGESFQYNSGDLVYIISIEKPVKYSIKESCYEICRSFSHLQNYRSPQLFADDTKWKNTESIVWAWKIKTSDHKDKLW